MRQQTVLAAAVVAIALANAAPARAQGLATTTFVSGFGFDTNPCTVAAPCRSFQHAHDLTAAGGQITMLDPAGYGAVRITKAISIVNDGGGMAGITELGSGIDAITINAGASDVVALRGLTLNGVGSGSAAATIALVNSQAIGNSLGVTTGIGTIVMSRVTLAGNTTIDFTTTSVGTFDDNYIIDTTNSGTLTPVGLQ